MTVIDIIRDATARRTALYGYAQAHDHFSELEQALVGEGRVAESAGAHEYALIALRAYRAELDDQAPLAHDCAWCPDDTARDGQWR